MSTPAAEEAQIPLAVDEFTALEERVLRMVKLVRTEREARAQAEERIHALEESVHSLEETGLNAEQRVIALEESLAQANAHITGLTEQGAQAAAHAASLEEERTTVRSRVEKLLRQMEEVPE